MPNIISITTVTDSSNTLTSIPITVPGTALGVAVFGAFDSGTNGTTLGSISMTGAGTFTIHQNVPTVSGSFERCAWCATASVSSTGSQTWSASVATALTQGCHYFFVWLDEAPTVRGSGGDNTAGSAAISISATSAATDLVIALDAKFNAVPTAAPTGWTSQATAGVFNGQGTRLSTCDSPGASSTTFDAVGEDYSAAVILALEGAASGTTIDGALGSASASGFTASVSATTGIACALATAAADGFTATLSGTLVTDPLKNNTATVLASETGVEACIYDPTDGTLVVKKTGLTTDAGGVLTISDALLVAGTTYWVIIKLTSGALGFTSKAA